MVLLKSQYNNTFLIVIIGGDDFWCMAHELCMVLECGVL